MPLNKGRTAKALGIGTGAALAAILILVCIIDTVMLMLPSIPKDALPYILLAATGIGVFAGGYITAAISRTKGLVMGLICGMCVFLILLVIGLCTKEKEIGALTFLRLGICILCGILGGIKGVNRKEKLHIK